MTGKHHNEAIPNVPRRRIRKLLRTEGVFYGSIVLTTITMAVSIIYLQGRNLQVQQEITNLDNQISDMQTDCNNAKQEINKLASRDRIE